MLHGMTQRVNFEAAIPISGCSQCGGRLLENIGWLLHGKEVHVIIYRTIDHRSGRHIYQVGAPMIISSCLTTKPNFL